MELKPGYKRTEAGVIPKDWDVKPLGGIAQLKSGYAFKSSTYTPLGAYKVITIANVQDGYMDAETCNRIAMPPKDIQPHHRLQVGDILISMTGNVGRVCLVAEENCLLNQRVGKLSPLDVDCSFLLSLLGQRQFLSAMSGKAKGGAQGNLSVSDISEYLFALPTTISEQRAIAAALSDVDALLAKLDQLIAKKRNLKQAAMQQLLTGNRRLPGFSGEWKKKRLGDLGHFAKGSGVKKDETTSGDLPCVRYGELYTRHNDYVRAFYSWISPDVAATAARLKRGDLLFAGSGETKEEIGKCAAFVEDMEAYAGGDIVILRPHNSNPIFLGYYLNTSALNAQKASRGQGDAVVHISAKALAEIEITIPQFDEQIAIAAVLSDMDAEIAALEARLEKTRALKQGMTQELLTGRIRLV